MNFLLKEEGFLDGEPGSYTVTEKGEKYADEQYHSRGTGGYSQYNKAWETRTWDEEIASELDITNERKREVRQAISAAKQRKSESGDEEAAIDCDSFGDDDADKVDGDGNTRAVAVGVLLFAASAYGVYKAVPYIGKFVNDKVVPGLKNMKDRVLVMRKEKEEAGDEA
ncbi:hypothetical protein OG784_26990 [Streptomyces sp. NBC_01617]|uniref:hypothetical protein n=1 Tax=Streptomyces sp. NBC_01617 TaxID=2975899 RepID=UPI00386958A2|nr:hypothetical protein OG784_26990 [Streptomyces sp. NBC_01617]